MSQVLKHLSSSSVVLNKERDYSNPVKAARTNVCSNSSSSTVEAINNKDPSHFKDSRIRIPEQIAEPNNRTYIDLSSSYSMKLVETNPNTPYSFLVF